MGNVDAGLVKSLRPLRAPAARRIDGRPWDDQRGRMLPSAYADAGREQAR
jgi:hypothetical protein